MRGGTRRTHRKVLRSIFHRKFSRLFSLPSHPYLCFRTWESIKAFWIILLRFSVFCRDMFRVYSSVLSLYIIQILCKRGGGRLRGRFFSPSTSRKHLEWKSIETFKVGMWIQSQRGSTEEGFRTEEICWWFLRIWDWKLSGLESFRWWSGRSVKNFWWTRSNLGETKQLRH